MTVARQIIPGRTYLISRRCTQRQFQLRPDPVMNQIYLYCLAEAAERYCITLHAAMQMGNHHHLVLRDNEGNLPEFLCHMHAMMAKATNAYRGRWENLWATEQANAVYLVEDEDQFAKLIYVLANPVIDQLVERATDWPGFSSLTQTLSGLPKTVTRPRGYFRRNGKMPATATLRFERLAGFEELSDDDWRQKVLTAIAEEEEQARQARKESGRSVVGRKAILRSEPTSSPNTIEPRRNLRPQLACRNTKRRIEELKKLIAFRAARARCLRRMRSGERNVAFPYGTYRIRGVFRTTAPPIHG